MVPVLIAVGIALVVTCGVVYYLLRSNADLREVNARIHAERQKIIKDIILSKAGDPTMEVVKKAKMDLANLQSAEHETKTQGVLDRAKGGK